jgi:hypothetical protein
MYIFIKYLNYTYIFLGFNVIFIQYFEFDNKDFGFKEDFRVFMK